MRWDVVVVIPTYERWPEMLHSVRLMVENHAFAGLASVIYVVSDGWVPTDDDVLTLATACDGAGIKVRVLSTGSQRRGQNAARNAALRDLFMRQVRFRAVLFLDDDAHIEEPGAVANALQLMEAEDVRVLGLQCVTPDGVDVYFRKYSSGADVFPVVLPCLAACLVDEKAVRVLGPEMFRPERISYGTDEWALALGARLAGYQVYGTRRWRAVHRMVSAGRDRDIHGRLQYGHGYCWGNFGGWVGWLLLVARLGKLVWSAVNGDGRAYFLERVSYLLRGFLAGRGARGEDAVFVREEVGRGQGRVRWLLRQAYGGKAGITGSLMGRLM